VYSFANLCDKKTAPQVLCLMETINRLVNSAIPLYNFTTQKTPFVSELNIFLYIAWANPFFMAKNYFFLFFWLSFSMYAQSTISLEELATESSAERIRIINRQTIANTNNNLPEANDLLLKEAIEFAKKQGDNLLLKELMYLKIQADSPEKDPRKRIKFYQNIIESKEFKNEPMYKGVCFHQIGSIYFVLEEYGLAFQYLLNAQSIFKEIGYENIPNIGKYLHDLSLDYYFFKNYEETIKLMKTSIELPKFDDILDIQRYNTLGVAYLRSNKLDSALVYLNKALQKAEDYQSVEWIGLVSGNIGNVYFTDKNYPKALPYFLKNYELNQNTYKHFEIPLGAASNLAELYLATDSLEQAYRFIRLTENYFPKEQVFRFGQQQQLEAAKRKYYENFYQYYRKRADLEKAMVYRDSLIEIEKETDSIYNSALVKMTQDQLMIQEKQDEITQQEKENDVLRLRYGIGFSVVLLLTITGFSLYYIVRLKKKKEKQLHQAQQQILQMDKEKVENELKLAQSELSNFIQNINEKNKLIDTINEELETIKSKFSIEQEQIKKTENNLRSSKILTNEDWMKFQKNFEIIYPEFIQKIRSEYPNLTPADIRYLMLTKLNFSHNEMADALGNSRDSIRVTWNRVRNKLGGTLEDTPQTILEKIENNTSSVISN